jgi:hypothetical protein
MPYGPLQHLIHNGSVDGVPDHVTNVHHVDDFCENCMAGKLTHAPHTKLATCAEELLTQVFTDVHGPVPTRSWCRNCYWVSFIDDHLWFPAVYFIKKKPEVFGVFKCYKVWVENVTGQKVGILRDDKGGEYSSAEFDRFLVDEGIHHKHSICDTPQQLGIAECLNRTLDKGITTLLAQSGLSHAWWEDAALHFLHGKIRLPSSVTMPSMLYDLFYGRKSSVKCLCPFGCLTYVHLQKDQHKAFQLHTAQCVLIGYPNNYKVWCFWDPKVQREIVSDSAIFHESVFPLWQSSLSAIDKRIDPTLPVAPTSTPPVVIHRIAPDTNPDAQLPEPAPPIIIPHLEPPPEPNPPAPQLVPHILPPPPDIPERPQTPPKVRNLQLNFEHHLLAEDLPPKWPTWAWQPGALAEDAHSSDSLNDICIPLLTTIEYALNTNAEPELRSLAEALKCVDAAEWVKAALNEIDTHLQNGTWELAQLPLGRRAIGSRWVFKIKRTLEGLITQQVSPTMQYSNPPCTCICRGITHIPLMPVA